MCGGVRCARFVRPAGPEAADPQPRHQWLERQRVMALPGGGGAGQRPALGVGQQVNLGAQSAVVPVRATAAPAARLGCPWGVRGGPRRRADGRGPRSSRPRPSSPGPPQRRTRRVTRRGCSPRSRPLTSGDAASTPSSSSRRTTADPATANPSGSATTPRRSPAGDQATAHPDTASGPVATVPAEPIHHRSDHDDHA